MSYSSLKYFHVFFCLPCTLLFPSQNYRHSLFLTLPNSDFELEEQPIEVLALLLQLPIVEK